MLVQDVVRKNIEQEQSIWKTNMQKFQSNDKSLGDWEKKENGAQTTIVLATVLLRIQNTELRAMLDTGAQIGCITRECVKKLKLKTFHCQQEVFGIGGPVPKLTSKVRIFLRPWFKSEFTLPVDLFVIDFLNGNYPSSKLTVSMQDLPNVTLADREFEKPSGIDMLLSAEVWAKIVLPGMYHNRKGALLQETHFGYIFLGCAEAVSTQAMQVAVLQMSTKSEIVDGTEKEPGLTELMQKFWEIEELANVKSNRSPEEEAVERIFVEKHYRDQSGRYIVHIPIKPNGLPLGKSRGIAERRFLQLEKRLLRDVELRSNYVDYMRDCQEKGYMRECTEPPSGFSYYIPHHCVTKKFRVVTDGSCRTSNGKSLNDIQMTGEKL